MLGLKIKFLLVFLYLFLPLIIHAEYTFITSIPIGAKVFSLEESSEKVTKEFLGTTPLKISNFSKRTKIVLEKKGHFSISNYISSSKSLQEYSMVLSPLVFEVQFPQQKNGMLSVKQKDSLSLSENLSLPYGNYSFGYNDKYDLMVEYKSPYIPYVAFFSSLTIVSIVLTITGGILGNSYFEKFQNSQSSDELISNIGKASAWDAVMWSGIGLSTAGLIGTAITAGLEVKDQKRIKRFNGMNVPETTSDMMSLFQEIILLSSLNHPSVLEKMKIFIKMYDSEESPLISDVYLKRAGIYVLQKKFTLAINDLKKVITKYPTRNNYELATKLLGDIYFTQEKYDNTYEMYKETLKVYRIYTYDEIKMLELNSLYYLANKNTKKYKEIFFLETEQKNISTLTATNQEIINKWRQKLDK